MILSTYLRAVLVRAAVRGLFLPGGGSWDAWASVTAFVGRTDAICVGAVFACFFLGLDWGGVRQTRGMMRTIRRHTPSTPSFPPRAQTAHADHARLLSWFLDAPFGVHRMAVAGKAAGKDVGMWFGPSAAAAAMWRRRHAPRAAAHYPRARIARVAHAAAPCSSDAGDAGKRGLQIVYASGFVNRLVTPALADPHTWKMFKIEVRKMKLVLQKPPKDRAPGVRELFAQDFVDEAEEEEGVGAGGGGNAEEAQRRDLGSVGRKKRAYCRRGRHPTLGVRGADTVALDRAFSAEGTPASRGGVEKGTLEALVHELVFATVFSHDNCDADEAARREEEWRDHSLTVLLCLPLFFGRACVETEFIRGVPRLGRGAGRDEAHPRARRVDGGRVPPPVRRSCGCGRMQWEDFHAEALPDVFFPSPQPVTSRMPASVSTQAMYTPSLLLGVSSPTFSTNTFSPRPDGGSARMAAGLSSRMPWAALETERLSRDVLLALDPHVLARSLTLFHRAVLEQAPDNPTAAFVDPGAGGGGACAPPFGSDVAPHWLTKLLLVQILGADTSAGAVHGGAAPGGELQQQPTTSRTHSRSEVISIYILEYRLRVVRYSLARSQIYFLLGSPKLELRARDASRGAACGRRESGAEMQRVGNRTRMRPRTRALRGAVVAWRIARTTSTRESFARAAACPDRTSSHAGFHRTGFGGVAGNGDARVACVWERSTLHIDAGRRAFWEDKCLPRWRHSVRLLDVRRSFAVFQIPGAGGCGAGGRVSISAANIHARDQLSCSLLIATRILIFVLALFLSMPPTFVL
ncbi:hypothetical protein B0H17DRAFT_1180673 [Mycena rosella]|uniref:Cysteine protease n=1 Tax=Mycena rosella TaxID=1033263 RepID=A0AAD7DBW7_MYCRO|nr:hypothetical protein B0H17DRAFT_1180673 [Mycena rosella]